MNSSGVSTAVTILLIFCLTSAAQDLEQNEANDCFRAGKCIEDQQTNENITCFGVRHPYRSFSFAFTGEEHIWMVQSNLSQWEGLRYVPKCWAVLQPLLCAVYYPKCKGDQISKVPYKLCEAVQKPCRIVETYIEKWPPFLQCNNASVFTSPQRKCQADHSSTTRRLINYDNVTSTCLAPYLLPTTQSKAFYQNVDGCGLSCTSDAQYSQDEQRGVKTSNTIQVSFGWIFGFAALFTMWIKPQKNLKSNVDFILVRIFLCRSIFALTMVFGMTLQFFSKSVFCEDDGTLRVSGGAPAFICGLSFFSIYVSELMDLQFLAILCFALSRVTKNDEKIKSHLTWFLIISFIVSIIIGIAAVSLHAVQGDSLVGICHVSKQPMHQAIFVIGIQGLLVLIALILYLKLAIETKKILKKFDLWIFGSIVISLLAVVIRIIDASVTVSDFDIWTQSLQDFLVCQGRALGSDCPRHTQIRPNLLLAYIRAISYFVPGFMTAIYVFINQEFISTWQSFLLPKLKGFVNRLEEKNDHDGQHQDDGLSLRTLSKAVSSRFRSRQNSMTSQVSLPQSTFDRMKAQIKMQKKAKLSRISRNHSTRSSLQSSINSHDLNMSQYSLASNFLWSKPRANQKNSRILTLDVKTIETQTSLTDLSGLATLTTKSKEEKSTQCNLSLFDQATGTTTTSSSQTEEKFKNPIEAHVTKIHVHHGAVSSEDSVPSSLQDILKASDLVPAAPVHHHRGRRGGVALADVQFALQSENLQMESIYTLNEDS